MGDRMTPIPFSDLIKRVLREKKQENSVFGVRKSYRADKLKVLRLFGEKIETPFGPAAGPNTQLAQNIAAAYYAGSRFFELKTVQKLDGEDLPVSKPCINAADECYNVEWSTELYVSQAFDEYVKAWWICKLMAIEFDIGEPDGFMFNMSVGYDLEGIMTPKIDNFIEGLKDASDTPIWSECKNTVLEMIHEFEHVTEEDINVFSPKICTSITLSTLHGCPPQEIERIASYLIEQKGLNTFVKCNPTLLGYEFTRKTMDEMGYDYISFTDFHFKDDLQYSDAVPMLRRLIGKAADKNLTFGVKLTNTFPVNIKANELPGEEMYMSGKSLYPLTTELAAKLSADFNGELRISYSGGADYNNIVDIFKTGIWPVTLATTILKPGGYERMVQIAEALGKQDYHCFRHVNIADISKIAVNAKYDKNHTKAVKPIESRKIASKVPLTDCFMAPCESGCPIHQDITEYMELVDEGKYDDALRVIIEKNPLPFITGTICAHRCMNKCTRIFYDTSVKIRDSKLKAAVRGYQSVLASIKEYGENNLLQQKYNGNEKIAVIGAGPTGLSAAYFLARAGIPVTVFDKNKKPGGIIRTVIPEFRIKSEDIDRDIELIEAMGVKIESDRNITEFDSLKAEGYTRFLIAIGAGVKGNLKLEKGTALNAIDFLEQYKTAPYSVTLGSNVIVVGGGNTAMDTARAAMKVLDTNTVTLVYRRTKKYMPADSEELEQALIDGVELKELLKPVKFENGSLLCRVCVLGESDESGRKKSLDTDEYVELPADTVIAAVGEKVDNEYYRGIKGLRFNVDGRVIVDPETLEAIKGEIYIAGDGLNGPATVVEGIRDARKAADAIINDILGEEVLMSQNGSGTQKYSETTGYNGDYEKLAQRHGAIQCGGVDSEKTCLGCNRLCGNCVEVCPNRANMFVKLKSRRTLQVVHFDSMCNECGNCTTFCPYDSSPYKDKFTYFDTVQNFEDSTNNGFLELNKDENKYRVRLNKQVVEVDLNNPVNIPDEIAELIDAVITKLRFYMS